MIQADLFVYDHPFRYTHNHWLNRRIHKELEQAKAAFSEDIKRRSIWTVTSSQTPWTIEVIDDPE